jgi:hypothetical protein
MSKEVRATAASRSITHVELVVHKKGARRRLERNRAVGRSSALVPVDGKVLPIVGADRGRGVVAVRRVRSLAVAGEHHPPGGNHDNATKHSCNRSRDSGRGCGGGAPSASAASGPQRRDLVHDTDTETDATDGSSFCRRVRSAGQPPCRPGRGPSGG